MACIMAGWERVVPHCRRRSRDGYASPGTSRKGGRERVCVKFVGHTNASRRGSSPGGRGIGPCRNKYITTYFRKSFSVANAAGFASVSLQVVRDDGAVVYLNGTAVFRTNMSPAIDGRDRERRAVTPLPD
jgi:hypothetical protein